jgi:hypothetical protein
MILQAIHEMPEDEAGYVAEGDLAERTRIAAESLREWLQTLEDKDYIDVARTEVEYLVSMRPLGRLVLLQSREGSSVSLSSGANARAPRRRILNFIYLDTLGIEGLSEQVPGIVSGASPETRFHMLFDYLFGSDGFKYSDLGQAAREAQEFGSQYVIIKEKFNLPQSYVGIEGVNSANASGYLELEIGQPPQGGFDSSCVDRYDPSDSYFKTMAVPRITFSASLSKFKDTPFGYMKPGSHMARYFGGYRGQGVPLGVFGELCPNVEFLHLKPFAIWR